MADHPRPPPGSDHPRYRELKEQFVRKTNVYEFQELLKGVAIIRKTMGSDSDLRWNQKAFDKFLTCLSEFTHEEVYFYANLNEAKRPQKPGSAQGRSKNPKTLQENLSELQAVKNLIHTCGRADTGAVLQGIVDWYSANFRTLVQQVCNVWTKWYQQGRPMGPVFDRYWKVKTEKSIEYRDLPLPRPKGLMPERTNDEYETHVSDVGIEMMDAWSKAGNGEGIFHAAPMLPLAVPPSFDLRILWTRPKIVQSKPKIGQSKPKIGQSEPKRRTRFLCFRC